MEDLGKQIWYICSRALEAVHGNDNALSQLVSALRIIEREGRYLQSGLNLAFSSHLFHSQNRQLLFGAASNFRQFYAPRAAQAMETPTVWGPVEQCARAVGGKSTGRQDHQSTMACPVCLTGKTVPIVLYRTVYLNITDIWKLVDVKWSMTFGWSRQAWLPVFLRTTIFTIAISNITTRASPFTWAYAIIPS